MKSLKQLSKELSELPETGLPDLDNEIYLNKCKEIIEHLEFHADGVKEVKCEFCDVNCGNQWCPYSKEKEQ